MCGIVAVLARRGRIDRDRLPHALAAMAHRGPDGSGIFEDGPCALLHARLAIVDRERGAQPLVDRDRKRALVVNGEIYGHSRMRAGLEAEGHVFFTRSDSEIALALYERDGDAMPAALRGELALALWDGQKKRLLLARDRFGIRPLYYAEHDGLFAAASTVKALFALGIPAAWDEDALHQVLSMQYARPGETLFRRIRSLRPGWRLIADHEGVIVEPYDEITFARSPERIGEAEAHARFAELLRDAVNERLQAEVPVAVQLSGGIDSSAIAALASQQMRTTCFTVSFRTNDGSSETCDELDHASVVAEHLGARHEIVEVRPRDVIANLSEVVERTEAPAIDSHVVAKWMLARRARALGFRVLLTGEGADELLAGYAHLRADLDSEAGLALASQNDALSGMHLPSGPALEMEELSLGFVPTWMRAKATLGYKVRELLGRTWRRARRPDPFVRAIESVDAEQALAGRGRVEQAQTLWIRFALAGYILPVVGDGAEMAHAVEGRPPFLEPRLWSEVTRWPSELRMRSEKRALREIMHGLLPESARTRPKHPFLGPAILVRGEPLLFDALAQVCENVPFLDAATPDRVRRLLSSTRESELRALEPALFLILSLALLETRVIARRST